MMTYEENLLPKISFIIPTLNAAWILQKCLFAIRDQVYPQKKVEIVIADGGSTDNTIIIAKQYNAIVINNPLVNQEPGKSLAAEKATGKLLFFTDADNIIVGQEWIHSMVKPYLENKNIKGFIPQTTAPPDSNSFNQYLGYLFTDPFTWFVYGNASNPKDYEKYYTPIKSTKDYKIYKFLTKNHPLFGLAQGVGTIKTFKKNGIGLYDDILAGIKLIGEGGYIAYIPSAFVYHYHIKNVFDFVNKYRWRIRNNLTQKIKGFGMVNRNQFMSRDRQLRRVLFIPYSLSIILPFFDSLLLTAKYKNFVMLWHTLACVILAITITYELFLFKIGVRIKPSEIYGK